MDNKIKVKVSSRNMETMVRKVQDAGNNPCNFIETKFVIPVFSKMRYETLQLT